MEKYSDKNKETASRQFPRVAASLQSDFRLIDSSSKNGERIHTQTRTLGGGGVMLVSPVRLKTGASVETRVYYYSLIIEFVGKVVWTETVEKFGHEDHYVGIKFQEILPENLSHIQNIIKSQQNYSH